MSRNDSWLTFMIICYVFFLLYYQETNKRTPNLQAQLSELKKNRRKIFSSHFTAGAIGEAECLLGTGSQSNGAFCRIRDIKMEDNLPYSTQLCRNIENLVEYSSIGDFGAGLGFYGFCFLRKYRPLKLPSGFSNYEMKKNFEKHMSDAHLNGTRPIIQSWQGFDGGLNMEQVTKGNVRSLDLSKDVVLQYKFDWVLSLEVAEHIPNIYEKSFIDNLVKHSCKGVILSWAIPGQGGLNHINCRTNAYVIAEMHKRNLKFDAIATKKLKANIIHLLYFKNTLMVFRKNDNTCV